MSLITSFLQNHSTATTYDYHSEGPEAFEQSLVQDPQTPIALILTSKYDPKKALFPTNPSAQYFVQSLEKTHRIAHRTIMKQSDIGSAIRSLPADRIKLLIINCHGDDCRFAIDREEIYGIEDVKPEDFEGLSDDAEIYLLACRTGNGLAQKIADVSNRIVFAPMQDTSAHNRCRSYCQQHQWELRTYEGNQQIVYRFQKHAIPSCCKASPIEDEAYFSELKQYLIDQGTPEAFFDLAAIYYEEGDLQKAKIYFQKAADLGNAESLRCLGKLLEKEWYFQQAKICFQKAAALGNVDALNDLGALFQKEGDLQQAIICYQKAADLGNAESLRRLGKLLEKEWYFQQAKICFQKAAALGNADALNDLGILFQKEGDLQQAKICFQRAAALGNADALNNLGILFRKEGDLQQAKIYYQRAIDLGVVDALFNLGLLFEKEGRLRDALVWYQQAADHGIPEVQQATKRVNQMIKSKNRIKIAALSCGILLASWACYFLAQTYKSRESSS